METYLRWLNSLSNKNLELILFITESCNFRCSYCYEDFKLGEMNNEVIAGIKNLISKRIGNLKFLNLSFFGGEPLLNKQAVFEMSDWAVQLSRLHNIKYSGSITTNGYLLDENVFDRLIRSEVLSFQITLDGEKMMHDKFRRLVSKEPTFNTIYSNVSYMAASNHNFNCILRFNVSDLNFNSIKSFISNYSFQFMNDNRFSFHFHPIFGMSDCKLSNKDQINELIEYVKEKSIKYDIPNHSLCYASKANSYVIRANGKIQKCTVSLQSEINNIGQIDRDGNLNLDIGKNKKWILAYNKGCPSRYLLDQ